MYFTTISSEMDAASLARNADEKRLTLRLWHYWNTLRKDRAIPALRHFRVEEIGELADFALMLDGRTDPSDPELRFIGRALARQSGVDQSVKPSSTIPPQSMLGMVVARFADVLERGNPLGVEDVAHGDDGTETVFRAVLLPFADNAESITFVVGAVTFMTRPAETNAAADPTAPAVGANRLAVRLELCRGVVRRYLAVEQRSHAVLYEALERAYGFLIEAAADPGSLAALSAESGFKLRPAAPETAVIKLIFGADYDKTRIAEYAAALRYLRRSGASVDAFTERLEQQGGVKGCVQAERTFRRSNRTGRAAPEAPLARLRSLPVLERVTIPDALRADYKTEFVVLIGRPAAGDAGTIEVLTPINLSQKRLDAVLRAGLATP